MAKVIRISLPGYDASSDTDPNHYALFADQDNILLKEKARGNLSIGNNYTHNLGYVPFYLTYGDIGGGKYQLATGYDTVSGVPRSRSTSNVLKTAGSAMKYFVFFNNIN